MWTLLADCQLKAINYMDTCRAFLISIPLLTPYRTQKHASEGSLADALLAFQKGNGPDQAVAS